MEKNDSFNYLPTPADDNTPPSLNSDFGFSDRRYAFARQTQDPPFVPNDLSRPFLSRTASSIDIPPVMYEKEKLYGRTAEGKRDLSVLPALRMFRSGSKPMKKLFLMISFNVAYSTVELLLGLITGRIGLVSDAFHLTFGCGLLTFSLFAMAASRKKADRFYTYGYKRLEVLSAFTNAVFLLFMSFSIAVEALHAFVEDESEHKHYLVISAVANLLVNLIGVWFFRNYARITVVYKKPEDMNQHAVCVHVLADSVRSAGLILASWLLSLGVENAEVLCLGLVSVTIFMLGIPLFKTTSGILLQMSPPSIPSSALSKCLRQINSREDVAEVTQSRFWEFVPGHVVGSLSVQVKAGVDDRPVLHFVHNVYHELGVQELTVQIEETPSLS
ncbi:hypothetical protein QQ045_003946 [Rhodiola kirilowii]